MESTYVIKEIKGADPTLDQYKALILATWLRNLRHGCDFFSIVEPKAFFDTYSKIITGLLKRPDCTVRLAVLSDDADTVVGWCVYEGKVLHFVYVKAGEKGATARKQGVAKSLLPKGIEVTTHMTRMGQSIWKRNTNYKHIIFNPF